jgi:uncharacterized protein (DUF58 family)
VQPTPLSRGIGAGGIVTLIGGGAMGSTPAVAAGALLLLFLIVRALVFLTREKEIIRSLRIERICDNLIIRQFGTINVTLTAALEIPQGYTITLRDLPGPGFEVIGDSPVLDLPERSVITYPLRAIARGAVLFQGVIAAISDPFFSTEVTFSRPGDRAPTLQVQPRGPPVLLSGESGGYGEAPSRRLLSPTGTFIRSFREYSPGDDPRQIDWKMTAKTSRLTIREAYAQRGEVPIIVLDIPRNTEDSERIIGFAAGFAEESLKVSHSISLLAVNGGNVVRFLSDERQVHRVLGAIRDLPPSIRATHFYRYASDAPRSIVQHRLLSRSPLTLWYERVAEIKGLPAFEVECIRAFARTKGTSLLLFSTCEGDISHIGMITRAAKRIGLSVHLKVPARLPEDIRSWSFPIDSVEVI